VIIERFWQTVKYEEVYPKAYQTTSERHGSDCLDSLCQS
jgi:hypothetical protein